MAGVGVLFDRVGSGGVGGVVGSAKMFLVKILFLLAKKVKWL
jgi:hypothetical protein